MDSDLYITEKPLAARWSLSAATLQRWRWLRMGPAFYRFGKTVRYRLIDIEEFEKRAVIECDGRRYKERPSVDVAEVSKVDAPKDETLPVMPRYASVQDALQALSSESVSSSAVRDRTQDHE